MGGEQLDVALPVSWIEASETYPDGSEQVQLHTQLQTHRHTQTHTHIDTHRHTHIDTETDTCTHGHTRTHRQGRQERHDWHLNLTFQDTCVEQLLQCFWCLIITQATAVVWKEYSACPACCEGSHFGEKKWPVSAIVRSQCSVARLPLKRLYQVGSPDWTIKAQSVSFSQVLTSSNPTSPGHLHTSLNKKKTPN